MHGTRTTTKVLAGMAGVVGVTVAAITGCVSVEPPPPAPHVPVPAGAAEHPARQTEPQVVVEAPAREALEAAVPPAPERAEAPPRPKAPERAHDGPKQREAERARKKKQRTPGWAPGRPTVVLPPVLPKLPVTPPRSPKEVCDLGEKYGGWGRGSDQSRICRDTYGGGRG
ncbi:hypothetical protein [Streptomyces tritici]|uniref:hypothetical protein n=1 Tax=Streptomyces tritici TaxID=2054410 RepID=UPI003AF10316